jgi:hypothetical protein
VSRTDAHTPYRVRVARREIAVRAVHRCAGLDECDLPGLSSAWTIGRIGRCYREFTFTGTNVCCCWMCHWHWRPEVRRARVCAELRGVARDWNGGTRDAGQEV